MQLSFDFSLNLKFNEAQRNPTQVLWGLPRIPYGRGMTPWKFKLEQEKWIG